MNDCKSFSATYSLSKWFQPPSFSTLFLSFPDCNYPDVRPLLFPPLLVSRECATYVAQSRFSLFTWMSNSKNNNRKNERNLIASMVLPDRDHLDNAGLINFIHNHPPAHPLGFAPKTCPHLFLYTHFFGFCIQAVAREAGICWAALEGRHLSINDVCHFFEIFIIMRLTTLWGLLVALKFYTFSKKIIQS